MLIGLTGQIGAGKTAVANLLQQCGAAIIDADQIGREVVEKNPNVLNALVKKFGREILTPKGKLNRQRLAELAFVSETSRKALNRIVHPQLVKTIRKQAKLLAKKYPVVVIDAALLLEWKMEKTVDLVLVVTAREPVRLKRLARRGISSEDALARQKRQLSESEFRLKADFIIPNEMCQKELAKEVRTFWQNHIAKQVDRSPEKRKI